MDTNYALGMPNVLRIKYKKPSGDTGSWDADVVETTKAQAIVENGDLNESGLWTFQVYVEIASDGWQGHGRVFRHRIQVVEVD